MGREPLHPRYTCQSCGYRSPKWLGRCPHCGQWDSLVEEVGTPVGARQTGPAMTAPEPITAISSQAERRFRSGLGEFDRTLGGGLVPGSVVLIGGDPGIGKSTLILQVLDRLAASGLTALLLSGEESPQQIKLRAERLGVRSERLLVMAGTCLEDLLDRLKTARPDLLAVDSIQTVYTQALSSAPGSVGQIREVAARLMNWAKESGRPVFLIGHVTKEGAIAGPKILEHLVDTVLYFEGDRGQIFRILRAVKNRFGSTNEIGVFEMKEAGLDEVTNPSQIFLEERPRDVPGSVVMPCIEGTRPLLVEIQALVGPSPLGMPRRTTIGIDPQRISLLVAVLAKRMGMELGDQDIFVNVAGGLRVDEPATDLAIVAAMISSFLDAPVPRDTALFGEIGLAAEIRSVGLAEIRVREARKLGFERCIMPLSNCRGMNPPGGMHLSGVDSVHGLFDLLFA